MREKTSGEKPARWLGILADPEVGPAEVAGYLAEHLPTELSEAVGDEFDWKITVEYERLPAGSHEHTAMINRAEVWKADGELDLVVCITDLPMRTGRNPVAAELSTDHGVAVVSLPAFGGMAWRRRSTEVVVHLTIELLGLEAGPDHGRSKGTDRGTARHGGHRLSRRLRVEPVDNDSIDRRIVTTRGGLRLLIGMVRDNRPWRLAMGLSRAVVAAFALSAFYLVSSGVWELSNALGPVRLAAGTVGSLAVLVCWLIIRHNLWEFSHQGGDRRYNRDQVVLFNATTVLTLTVGAFCLYLVLFLAVLAAAFLFVSGDVVASYAGSGGLSTYLNLAWMTSSVATLAGALGAGLDSEKAVRAAAYSTRERERRASWEKERRHQDETEEELSDPEYRRQSEQQEPDTDVDTAS